MEQQKANILIVDDDPSNVDSLSRIVEREGMNSVKAYDGTEALNILAKTAIDLIITDLKMKEMDGFELLKEAKKIRSDIEVIVVTAHGTIERAVTAMRAGAFDFISKPFERKAITQQIHRALEKYNLKLENASLKAELSSVRALDEIIGRSHSVKEMREFVEQVAPTDATVLILGESGTGKELLARALHRASRRFNRNFVKINCNTLPENLLEAELFGSVRGAFTGATADRKGRFEIANGGTLFLDEIGDLSPAVQGKLLRVLQEGEFEKLGSNRTISTDVRIITATNRDLNRDVKNGRFREDLYYRLNVIQKKLSPLRQRTEDIPLLADFFLKIAAEKHEKGHLQLSQEALNLLQRYSWPGNIRELKNAIENAVVFSSQSEIGVEGLPNLEIGPEGSLNGEFGDLVFRIGSSLKDVETVMIQRTLEFTAGDKAKAAEILGIGERTLYRKLSEQ